MSRIDKFKEILDGYEGRKYEEPFEAKVQIDMENIWECFSHDGYKDTIRMGVLTGRKEDDKIFIHDVIIRKGQTYDDKNKTMQLDSMEEEFLGLLRDGTDSLMGVALYCGYREISEYAGFIHEQRFQDLPVRLVLNHGKKSIKYVEKK